MFYNGTDPQPERQTLKLSDAYVKEQDEPELELTVTIYNINLGKNKELMEACSLLREYGCYVEKVREYAAEMEFPEAVERAVDYCIRNGILAEFLSRNRAEAIAVSIFEYNEEKHLKLEKEKAAKRVAKREKPALRSCCRSLKMKAGKRTCTALFQTKRTGNSCIGKNSCKQTKNCWIWGWRKCKNNLTLCYN